MASERQTGPTTRSISRIGLAQGFCVTTSFSTWAAIPVPATSPTDPHRLSPYMTVDYEVGDAVTNSIVRNIREVQSECASLPVEYRIDCLGKGLRWVASAAPPGVYDGVARSLSSAGSDLSGIASRNSDSAKPKIQADPKNSARWKASRSYRAVKLASLAAANAAAGSIITEAATALLRSSENSAKRRVHFAKISGARLHQEAPTVRLAG